MDPQALWHAYFCEALRAFLRAENGRPDDVDVMRAAKVAEIALDRHVSRWGVAAPPVSDRKPTSPGFRPPARGEP